MVRTLRRRRLQIRTAIGLALIAGAFLSGGAADAVQPNDVIEQHWDLLGTTYTTARNEVEPIRRGSLPGATSGFDPQPTATLEVVAKITGALGNGGYDIRLRPPGSGPDIASVAFRAADTTLKIKTASVPWPALNTQLYQLSISKVEPNVGDFAGTIEVKKAYLKLRQAGTITKTIGRAPVANKQVGIFHDNWQNLANVVLYKHVAADFDPAPSRPPAPLTLQAADSVGLFAKNSSLTSLGVR